MKRIPFALAVILLSLTAAAQELPPPVRVVISVLSLSEDQAHALIAAVQAREASVRPLAEQVHAREEALARLVESESPDAAEVGRLVLETHALARQIERIAHQAAAAFEQSLGEEQRARLAALRQAAPACEILPAFRAVGLF